MRRPPRIRRGDLAAHERLRERGVRQVLQPDLPVHVTEREKAGDVGEPVQLEFSRRHVLPHRECGRGHRAGASDDARQRKEADELDLNRPCGVSRGRIVSNGQIAEGQRNDVHDLAKSGGIRLQRPAAGVAIERPVHWLRLDHRSGGGRGRHAQRQRAESGDEGSPAARRAPAGAENCLFNRQIGLHSVLPGGIDPPTRDASAIRPRRLRHLLRKCVSQNMIIRECSFMS